MLSEKTLSILIPTLLTRKAYRDTLIHHLSEQIKDRLVQIIVNPIDKSMSIGKKRQLMLEWCNTDYVCFVDDDDMVSNDYVEKIYEAIQTDPDVVGLRGHMTTNGKDVQTWAISIRYNEVGWNQNEPKDGYRYVRCPNHLAPIKRELALPAGYKDMGHGEDYDYSMKLKELGLLKTEVFIDSEIYFYHFRTR